jgi:rhamnose transport system permease protein
MALPMTLIIITGEIDLSVASILALAAELLGYLWMHHWPMALIFVVVLAVGALAGAINAVLITRVGLPSLAVTIGTLTLYRGLANVVLGPTTVSNFPTPWSNLGVNGFLGIPWLSWSVAIFIALAVMFGVLLRMTPLGRSLYAIGFNQEAAFHAGIRVKRIKAGLFVLSGVVCAAVGMLYAFELSSAGENIGIGFELQVITIVLLGGVSIFGGKGTILGVALAAFVYAGLRSALLLTSSFNENDFQVVSGGLLILSVLIPNVPLFAQRLCAFVRRHRG